MRTLIQKLTQSAHPSQAALDSIIVLRRYSAGCADSAAALRALRHLEYVYGRPVKAATSLFRHAIALDDPILCRTVLFEALSSILDWVFRQRSRALLWRQAANVPARLREKVAALLTPPPCTVRAFANGGAR